MTTAGEAASLFGGSDSTDDPFALAVPDDHEPSGNDPFANLGPHDAASDLFDFAAHNAAESIVPETYPAHDTGGYEDQGAGWGAPSTQDYTHEALQGQYNHSQAASYPTYTATSVWSSTQGQSAENKQGFDASESPLHLVGHIH